MGKESGLTLIELLVVISILLIIIGITIQSFRSFQGEGVLSDSTETIINILRLAQSKTLASEGVSGQGSQYGVYFDKTTDPHQYVLFKLSDSVNYSDPLRDTSSDEIHQIPKSVEIHEIALVGGGQEIVFSRLTGETLNSGTVSLWLKSDHSKTRTVGIKTSGKITLGEEVFSPDDSDRKKDSRHVHFNYNQNVQNAVTLHLVFLDYPGDNFDISFQDYLNADKTEFFWEGIVSVGPAGSKTEQRLKIHTHSLTVMTTQFCIHRPLSPDQSYNDKALNIYLDDQEFIEYAADTKGTTTKGSSFWVENPILQ